MLRRMRSPRRRPLGVVQRRLILVTVAAAGALAAQTAMQHSDRIPEFHLPNWTSAGLATIAGVASVIFRPGLAVVRICWTVEKRRSRGRVHCRAPQHQCS